MLRQKILNRDEIGMVFNMGRQQHPESLVLYRAVRLELDARESGPPPGTVREQFSPAASLLLLLLLLLSSH